MSATSYITEAVLDHSRLLVARGLADGRPTRIDGFSLQECSVLRLALSQSHPSWQIFLLSDDNDELGGRINAERATRYRNEAAGHPDAPFVLFVPMGEVVESSLNEPAFYVVARATIFLEALARKRHVLRITSSDVQALREAAVFGQPEAIYAFLSAWTVLEGSVEPDASLLHLGLLADTGIDATSIETIKTRLRRHAEALEILNRPGISPARMVGELVARIGVDSAQHDELLRLKAWIGGGRVGGRPRLADFAEWAIVETDRAPPPRLVLTRRLTDPPHQGWSPSDEGVVVEDDAGASKLVWHIENRRPGLKVEVSLVEEFSQSVIKTLGSTQSLSKTIKWSTAIGSAEVQALLRELNPAGDVDGYQFRLRLKLLDGRTILADEETEVFAVSPVVDGVAIAAPAPTVWHAMYRFHTERAVSPYIVRQYDENPASPQLRDSGARKRDIKIDLSPALREIERHLLERPDFAGSWKLHLTGTAVANPSSIAPSRVRRGQSTPAFDAARRSFFECIPAGGLIEAANFKDVRVRDAATAYVTAWIESAKTHVDGALAGHGVANQTRLAVSSAASIDAIQVVFAGEHEGDVHEVLLIAPTHPAVVAWAMDFHDLVHDWTRGSFDPGLKPPYRSPSSGAALGGVERFSVGPRGMVLFTAFENEIKPTAWAYSGDVHPLWQCFVRVGGDVGGRAREWPESLSRLLGLSAVPAGGNRIDARRVGSRLKKYAVLHPYIRQLKVAALMAGDGQPILDALKVIDERPGTPAGALSMKDLRHELHLIGPRTDRLGAAIEDLTANPGDARWRTHAGPLLDNPETVLAPGFSYGIHSVDAREDLGKGFWPEAGKALSGLSGGINVTVVGPLLETSVRPVLQPRTTSGFAAKGLVSRPMTVVTHPSENDPFAGNWTIVLPPAAAAASVAAAAQQCWLSLCDVAGGAVKGQTVGLDLVLAGPVSAALRTAHEVSDWVVIADPLFSVELMDRAATTSKSFLLDYSPEFDAYPGGRVVVSTSTLSELDKLGAGQGDAVVASPELLRVLASISARLLLSLANPTKQTVRGLHGLALTRVFLQTFFPDALVIPMDGHADMFAVPRVSGTSRLADLLVVSIESGRLRFAVVESKWVGKANLQAKVHDGATQARTSQAVIASEYLEYAGVDRAVRTDALREIILFHLARAERHGLPAPFSADGLIEAMADDLALATADIDAHLVVWCPDAEAESSTVDAVALVQMGEAEIRRYAAAMATWPHTATTGQETAASGLDAIFEELIGGTLEDDLADRERSEVVEDASAAYLGDEPGAGAPAAGIESLEQAKPSSGAPAHEVADSVVDRDRHARATSPQKAGKAGSEGSAIHLGSRVSQAQAVVWAPAQLANGHLAVLGGSGAGKTTLLRKLAACLIAFEVPVLVLDFHGDLTLPATAWSYDFSYDGNAAFVNPLHLDPAYANVISPSRLKWEFLEAWRSQYPSLGIQQRNYLTNLIEEAYRQAGITNDPATWLRQVDFGDVLRAFDASDASDAQRQRIDAYMKQYREWCVFHGGTSISVESMLERPTRLNLSQLDEGARNIVADVILRRLFLLAKALGPLPAGTTGWDRFRVYVVIDEAQVLLTSNSDAKASLAKYASEARKFGIGLILATQLRDNIPPDVWGNIDTRMWMLALDQVERQKNAKAANIPEQSIAGLKQGEAFLVASSQPSARPVHLKIDAGTC